MSYDLTIRGDEKYSQATARVALDAFLIQLPDIQRNGENGFVLDDLPRRWLEFDLEVVTDDGDCLIEAWKTYDTTNCIRLHIPYQFLGDALESGCLPTAFAIAEFVGWPLHDEQTDRIVTRAETGRKPWWRFWCGLCRAPVGLF